MIKPSVMKKIRRRSCFILCSAMLIAGCLSGCGTEQRISRPDPTPNENVAKKTASLHHFKLKSLNGEEVSLGEYKGRHLLIVNVASFCGYTPQYAELQKLHEQYGDRVAVLGFPANNFMGQEPGSSASIAEFCEANYGVTFPMFGKISVTGDDQHPLYQWLSTPEANGWNAETPSWNFCKYLVDADGNLIKFFGSAISPLDAEILSTIDPQRQGPRATKPPTPNVGESI